MLPIASESRASDASYHALVDAAHAAADLAHWLIVGGHMVAARSRLRALTRSLIGRR
jgi:hypothetical protein